MVLRMHEISEGNHRILNPFTEEKLMLLGEICRLKAGMRQLDLCCGKAEMLCQWARRWGIEGIGVDISKVFLAAARERTAELGVERRITLIEADAGKYVAEAQSFDVVSCIGATWIGNGLVGTLKLMLPALKPGGVILVGEPYWIEPPPKEALASAHIGEDEFTSLIGTLDRIESAGLELVEMVLADQDSWDRYVASQWWTVHEWVHAHTDDPEARELHDWIDASRRDYLTYGRRYLGWGVFVLRVNEP
ncbi:MAG TPA: methyltransferase domain-containing protein [Phototrophicaceae bacterium]|nr:methyltransferase domain-containing protein [Phototrophicaceae bacterium]